MIKDWHGFALIAAPFPAHSSDLQLYESINDVLTHYQ